MALGAGRSRGDAGVARISANASADHLSGSGFLTIDLVVVIPSRVPMT